MRLPPSFRDEGIRAALEARARVPGLPVLVLSQYVERVFAKELLADGSGGVGYLLKDRVADPAEFVDAVRRVAAGGTAMDPEVVAQLVAGRGPARLEELTPRERDVLSLMAEGRSNAAIARGPRRHRGRRREAHLEHLREARPAAQRGRSPARAGGSGMAGRVNGRRATPRA